MFFFLPYGAEKEGGSFSGGLRACCPKQNRRLEIATTCFTSLAMTKKQWLSLRAKRSNLVLGISATRPYAPGYALFRPFGPNKESPDPCLRRDMFYIGG